MLSSDTERWIEAGCIEPMSADNAVSGKCEFDCGAPADYVVQFDDGQTVACCSVCSVSNRLYVEENDLLKTGTDCSDDIRTDGGERDGEANQSAEVDDELKEAMHWVERELQEARRALWDGKSGKAFASIEAAQDEFETVEKVILDE